MKDPTKAHLAFSVMKPSLETKYGAIEYVYLPDPDDSSEKCVCEKCIHRSGCNAKTIIVRDLPSKDEKRVMIVSCTVFSDGQKHK